MSNLDPVEQRLRTALAEAAEQVHVSVPQPALVGRHVGRPRLVRIAVVAAALAAVVALVASVLLVRETRESRVTTTPPGTAQQVAAGTLLSYEQDLGVFFNVDATPAQVASVLQQVRASPHVAKFAFLSHADAYQEFRRLAANALAEGVDPRALPESIKIVVRSCAARQPLARQFESLPGVQQLATGPSFTHEKAKLYEKRGVRWLLRQHGIRNRCGESLPKLAPGSDPNSTIP